MMNATTRRTKIGTLIATGRPDSQSAQFRAAVQAKAIRASAQAESLQESTAALIPAE